ncbi:MAG: Heptaprenyl diphosphate synthase component I [Firmicutes bacterium ADurb.Bin193]|nr:MAG: Heptaprenyl diphosphate synthase component I [Firmicutes bacterium ADurb.Bin193]
MKLASKSIKLKRLATVSVMTCVGIVLQIIESRIPIPISLPGGKIGLANIVSVLLIPTIGGGYALAVAILRALVGSMLFGGLTGAIYSVSGAVFSTVVMTAVYKWFYPRVTFIGIGVLGAASHNIAQTFIASLMLSDFGVFTYLPFLIIISVFSGGFTGFAAGEVVRHLK